MANYDIMSFLEYYEDRSNVRDPITGKRAPQGQWQNFYQVPQIATIDTDIDSAYGYLAFEANGYGSTLAASVNNLTVSVAAIANIVDITESAMENDNLIIASLYIQDAGEDSFDGSSAQLISRYIGSIESASLGDEAVDWVINPSINKLKSQVPTRKITADMLLRVIGI